MKVGSLFAGIGGFDLGLERAGFEIAWQVEIDPYCQRVLAKHWPNVQRYSDIRAIDWGTVPAVDIICGGFPCQPFSFAGQRRQAADDRNLWPEMRGAINRLRPTWMLGENVIGAASYIRAVVKPELVSMGYRVRTYGIPACAVGARHLRQRVWIVAYHASQLDGRHYAGAMRGQIQQSGKCVSSADVADAKSEQGRRIFKRPLSTNACNGRDGTVEAARWPAEPSVGRVAHGIPHRVDRLRGLGNSIVPQIAEWLGRQIMSSEQA